MKKPLGVTLISYLYFFGALLLLLSAIFYNFDANSIGITERFGLPAILERSMRIVIALFMLVMIYGYTSLKKWGFWTMIIYSVIFGITGFLQSYTGNMVSSMVILIYTIYVKDWFFNNPNLNNKPNNA